MKKRLVWREPADAATYFRLMEDDDGDIALFECGPDGKPLVGGQLLWIMEDGIMLSRVYEGSLPTEHGSRTPIVR